MLVQDHLTGQLHEVPDEAAYAYTDGGYGYDGLGNPVGFPALLPILGKIAPAVLPSLLDVFSKGFRGAPMAGYGDGYELDGFGNGYGAPAGALHYGAGEEIPQGQVLYDGFGNAVGFAPLSNLVKRIAPAAARFIAPIAQTAARAVGNPMQFIRSVLPGGRAPTSPGIAPRVVPAPFAPGLPVPMPFHPAIPSPFRPIPAGWQRPPVPYTGARPMRAYLRCAVWPGPRGLVPTAPGAVVPGATLPGLTPPAPSSAALRRRRRRRR